MRTAQKQPVLWSTRPSRRRPLTTWLVACCVVVLIILLINTWSLTHDAATGLERRGDDVSQEPLSPSEDEVAREEVLPDLDSLEKTSSGAVQQQSLLRQQASNSDPESNSGSGSASDSDTHPRWLFTPDTPAFPSYEKYTALVAESDNLPDIVYIPFEDAVKDDVLTGWEAEWLMDGTYDAKKWGLLKEPRIDFVYTYGNVRITAFTAHVLTPILFF